MARTAISPSVFVANANLADPAGTAGDATNNHIVSDVPFDELVLRVVNADAAGITATIKGGPGKAGFGLGAGDKAVTVAAGATQFIGPFESARFSQADGSLWLDLSADTSVTVTAFQLKGAF